MQFAIVRMPPDVLAHYGVKGMKWGVRNYQNKDGTLTELGKSRLREKRKNAKAAAADDGQFKTLSIRHKKVKDLPSSDPELVRKGEYWYNQNGEMIADIRYSEGNQPHNDRFSKPNAVTEYYESGKRQINRLIYDDQGAFAEEINGGPHGRKSSEDLKPDGVHAHKHDNEGKRINFEDGKHYRKLTEEERKEHRAALPKG